MIQVLELLGCMIQSLITLTLLAAALILFAGLVVMVPVAIGLLVYHVLMKLSNRRHGPVSEKRPLYELPSIVVAKQRTPMEETLYPEKKAA